MNYGGSFMLSQCEIGLRRKGQFTEKTGDDLVKGGKKHHYELCKTGFVINDDKN